jgi:hypothetical protein
MQVVSVKPNNFWNSSDISGYYAAFTKDTALSEQGRGAAWHV